MIMTIKRIFRFVYFISRIEFKYLPSSIASSCLKIIRPLVNLFFTRQIIDLVFINMYQEVLKYTSIMIIVNLILMLIEGYFSNRSELYTFKLQKIQSMERFEKLMKLEYALVESDFIQDMLSELQYRESTGIHNFSAFGKNLAIFFSSTIGILITLFFLYDFFIANTTFDLFFVIFFILLNILSYLILSYSNNQINENTSNSTRAKFRYVRSYMNLIYNYRTGKDIRFYDKEFAENAGNVYKDNMIKVYSLFWSVFGKGHVISEIMNNTITGMIFLLVGMKAVNGIISPGEVVLYIGLLSKLSKNINELAKSVSILIQSDPYRKMLFDFMDLEEVNVSNRIKNNAISSLDKWEIEFIDVNFKYPNTENYVIKDFSYKFKTGDIIAIVGLNGSGKSTLLKLLLRLYEPTKGEIKLNGVNINQYELHDYQDIFSAVFQDFKLLAFTLGENISLSTDYDVERVHNSLKKVGLSEFMNRHGLNSYLFRDFDGSGIEISGGEAQKIALARALYRKSNVVILDEPTAAMDPISEHRIYTSFSRLTEGKTSIFVSHRLSSCVFCNNIIVLDNGRLVQYGSHENLVSDRKGLYYSLWRAQAKHYK